MYSYWKTFLCSDGTLMSSASVVHGIGCFHNILDITYVTYHNIYYIEWICNENFLLWGKSGWLYWKSLGRCPYGGRLGILVANMVEIA